MGVTICGITGMNEGNLKSCSISGEVNGTARIGGLIGINYSSVDSSSSNVSVNGVTSLGGLIGSRLVARVSNSV